MSSSGVGTSRKRGIGSEKCMQQHSTGILILKGVVGVLQQENSFKRVVVGSLRFLPML